MGYTFHQPASNFSKPQEDSDNFYRAVDTSTFCDITESNYYPNLLINRAFHKGGTYTNNKGKEVGYEFLSLELIDDQRYIKANCTIWMRGRDTDRLDELVVLLGLKDEHGNPGFTFKPCPTQEKGKISEFVEDMTGKRIDAVLYDFQYDDKGYIRFKIGGFFLNGMSASEVFQGVQPQNAHDIQACMSWVKVGEGVAPLQCGTPPAPSNDVQVNAAQMQQAPYPQQPVPQMQSAPVPQMQQPVSQPQAPKAPQRKQRTPLPRQTQIPSQYAQAQSNFYQNAAFPQPNNLQAPVIDEDEIPF